MSNGLLASQKRGVYLTVAAVVSVITILLGLFVYGINKPVLLSDSELKTKGTFLFENPREFKPFTLLDDRNQPFVPASLQGKWSLVFFGFTFCPDVCPTTLALRKQG